MSETYKFKFRVGSLSFELEGPDADFIREEIDRIMELSSSLFSGDRSSLLAAALEHEKQPAPAEAVVAEPAAAPVEKEAAPVKTAPPSSEPRAKAAPETPPAKPKKASPAKPQKEGRKKEKETPKGTKAGGKKKESAPKKTAAAAEKQQEKPATTPSSNGIDPQVIAEKVASSKKFDALQEKVLKKPNQLNRILISFLFAEEVYGKKGLTTGDVESITTALDAGIKSTNISSQLKKHDALFESEGERKRGSVVHYTLNKEGREKAEQILAEA
jgi:hypothetical protein